LAPLAVRRAERELHCAPPALRVRGVGRLLVGPLAATQVELYEASGCEQEQLYLCSSNSGRCERELGALPRPETHAALARAEQVLRAAARARCPEAELRVTQESETLFRFEACDGAWLYHCRARGCERLPARDP
jgi:hypothetical protein